ncbi:MAG: hypothetical protein J6W30_03325 [Bacteroidales bacterium]|nr:hypothetical protein [Bacteroidales bacterium]
MIGIGLSFLLGGLLGWIADHILNRGEQMVMNPMICIIFGILGGVAGSIVMYTLGIRGGLDDVRSLFVQLGSGAVGSVLFLFLIALFGRGEDY